MSTYRQKLKVWFATRNYDYFNDFWWMIIVCPILKWALDDKKGKWFHRPYRGN